MSEITNPNPAENTNKQDSGKTEVSGDSVQVKKEETPTGSQPDNKVETKKEIVYDLKLPDGSRLDPVYVTNKITDAKSRGLTNEQAQEELKRESELISNYVAEEQKKYEDIKNKWLEEGTSDKEIGGDGFAKNLELAKRLIEKFDTEGTLKKDLELTGYGNYPPLVKFLVRIGKSMAEDEIVKPSASITKVDKSPAEIFYGKQ